jgi:hypothetical protein
VSNGGRLGRGALSISKKKHIAEVVRRVAQNYISSTPPHPTSTHTSMRVNKWLSLCALTRSGRYFICRWLQNTDADSNKQTVTHLDRAHKHHSTLEPAVHGEPSNQPAKRSSTRKPSDHQPASQAIINQPAKRSSTSQSSDHQPASQAIINQPAKRSSTSPRGQTMCPT